MSTAMASGIRVIVLAAGPSPENAELPVLLAEHGGQLLVERFVAAFAPLSRHLVFAVRAGDVRRVHLDNVIELAAPGAAVVAIGGETQGAACTALLCVENIALDEELLIVSGNEILDLDYAAPVADFRARGLDAGVVTFPSLHPRYSYVRLGDGGLAEEAAEKRPISRAAMASYFWFRRGGDFLEAAQAMIAKDAQVDGKFYVSLVLNELILRQMRVGNFPIEAARYHPLKSRRQVDLYEAERSGATP